MFLLLTQAFPPRLGGVEALMAGLAGALAEQAGPVTVFADGGNEPFGREDADGAPYEVVRFGGLKPLRRRAKGWAAARLWRRTRVRAVICDSWKSLERIPRPPIPTLVFGHGMELPAEPSPSKAARIRGAFAKADVVCVNSRFTAALARPYVPAGAELRITAPPTPPQAEADPAALARYQELRAGGPLVVTLGRLEPRKGVDRLIEAVAALRARHPGLRLLIAGSGGDRPRLEALALRCGLDPAAVFLGRIDDAEKSALLQAADVFAMPVRREGDSVEGFGVVYLEAGWHGAPSLAGRDGGSAEAVQDGVTGLLCDGADGADVTAQLDRLLSDAPLRARLGEAARAHAQSRTWPAVLAAHLPPGVLEADG